MDTFKISVTVLEKFRRFLADTSIYDTEADLLASVSGTFTGTDKTVIGSAFHQLCEDPRKSYSLRWQGEHYIVQDGIAFTRESAYHAFNYHTEHKGMHHEVPTGKLYRLPGQLQVYVSGRLDGIKGATGRDIKVKFRNHRDVHEYMDSIQWKTYCDILGVRVFYYDIFEVVNYGSWPGVQTVHLGNDIRKEIAFLKDMQLIAHPEIYCTAYPSMHQEITTTLVDFMEWIDFRGLRHLLTRCNEKGFKLQAA